MDKIEQNKEEVEYVKRSSAKLTRVEDLLMKQYNRNNAEIDALVKKLDESIEKLQEITINLSSS